MLHTALLAAFSPALAPLAPAQEAPLAAQDWFFDESVKLVDPGAQPNGLPGARYIDGRVLVRYGAGVEDAATRAAILGERFQAARVLVPGLQLYLVEILDGTSVEDARAELESRRGVVYASPDHVVRLRDTFPNDTSFSNQFGKHNTGQTGGTPDADMDAPEAWDYGTGSSDFVVGIVDGGTQHGHPDLIDNRWENTAEVNGTPGVDDDGNGYVDDEYGWDAYQNDGSIPTSNHATHVAGIAVARGNNGLGVAGVSWNSRFVSIAGSSSSTSTVMIAYGYALDLKDDYLATGGTAGANIVAVNSSFGIDFADCTSGTYAPWNDMYDLMGQSGILSCAATMNSANDVDVTGDVPTSCASDYLITVTATNDSDVRTFSAWGATTIDLGAPGESIYSTTTWGYGSLSGTSMATPQVTGAVAYLHSVAGSSFAALRDSDPAAAALVLKAAILDNVDIVGNLQNDTVSGGRMNLKAAADALVGPGPAIQNYCGPAVVNSSGTSAAMSSAGSNQVAQNMFSLRATGLPPGQTTLFLAATQSSTPVLLTNSFGYLCLGGSIGRFNSLIQTADVLGEAETQIDLTDVPLGTGSVAVLAGETYFFQAWFRDTILFQSTSNLTDGLRVTFE